MTTLNACFQKGMSFAAFGREKYNQRGADWSLAKLAATGADWISLDCAREILLKQVNDPFPRIAAARPEVPKLLSNLITRLVEEIPGSDLGEAAIEAAGLWQFTPARMDGVPVRVWKNVRVRFAISSSRR